MATAHLQDFCQTGQDHQQAVTLSSVTSPYLLSGSCGIQQIQLKPFRGLMPSSSRLINDNALPEGSPDLTSSYETVSSPLL